MASIFTLPKELTQQITTHIEQLFPGSNATDFQISPLTPDGSERLYYRISYADDFTFIAVDAMGTGRQKKEDSGLCQNQTFIHIRDHLANLDFPVPKLFSSSQNSDYYLLQDLGDETLYQKITKKGWNSHTIELYRDTLSLLLHLQTIANKNFEPGWCYAGGYYNRQLILNHELNYFLKAYLLGYCGIKIDALIASQLQAEFIIILNACAKAPDNFFLHRDFQSRNLMLKDQQIFLIDFQGARLGPYYYDLAALINDPYLDMPQPLRNQFCLDYFRKLKITLASNAPSQESFNYFFDLFSLVRTMQTLGAFGYLTSNQKLHFKAYIKPALKNLRYYLDKLSNHFNFKTLNRLVKEL